MKKSETYPTVKQCLGINISSLRERKGLSQRQFAFLLELDRATLNKIEQGKANPTLDTLIRIADGLDVDIESLFLNK